MKIVLLDNGYNIVHEFDHVVAAKSPKKWDRRVLEYRGKYYKHHDTQMMPGTEGTDDEENIHTFVEAEVLAINVTLGGG